jgi:hypothetical protein
MGCCTTLEAEVPDNASVGIESPRELRLHDLLDDYESDAQTVSEPGTVTKSVRDKVLVIRAKLKHQIDSDPNQFAQLNQARQQDLTPRDREHISEWATGASQRHGRSADRDEAAPRAAAAGHGSASPRTRHGRRRGQRTTARRFHIPRRLRSQRTAPSVPLGDSSRRGRRGLRQP